MACAKTGLLPATDAGAGGGGGSGCVIVQVKRRDGERDGE